MSNDASTSPQQPDRRWRGTVARRDVNPATRRRKRALVVLGGLLALVATLIGVFFFIDRPTNVQALSLPITAYQFPLAPSNRFAVSDAYAIVESFPASENHHVAIAEQRLQKIREQLERVALASGADPRVIHLTSLAVSWNDEAYLLAGDSKPEQPHETGLPLAEVLQTLGKRKASRVVLLLDVARPLADPRRGVIFDDIAQSVRETIEKNAPPHLLVLASCVDGQYSHASEDLGLSVFAYYAAEGLRGAADGWGADGRANGRVTARELAEFVAVRTERFVKKHFGLTQTPRLFGQGDLELTYWTSKPPELKEIADKAPVYPPWLQGAWKERDELLAGERFVPAAVIQLEEALLRLEREWRLGSERDRDLKQLEKDAQTLGAGQLEARRRPDWNLPPTSLAQAAATDRTAPLVKELTALARSRLKAVDDAVGKEGDKKELPMELAKIQKSLLGDVAERLAKDASDKEKIAKETKTVGKKRADDTYVSAAVALLDALEQAPGRLAEQLDLVAATMEKLRDPPPADKLVEYVWLRRALAFAKHVRDMDDPSTWNFPGRQVWQALRVLREREALLAEVVRVPFVLPWIDARFRAAETTRRQGEKLLFGARLPSEWNDAEVKLSQAKAEYGAMLKTVAALRAGRRTLDEALATLPGRFSYLLEQTQSGPLREPWLKALDQSRRLAERLKDGPSLGLPANDGADLLESLQTLQDEFEKRAVALTKPRLERELVEIEQLLAGPRLSAERRAELWQAQRSASLELLKRIQADDKESKPERTTSAVALEKQQGEGHAAAAATDALRRARLGLDLLKLADSPDYDALQRAWEMAGGKRGRNDLDDLAVKFGKSWLHQLPKQYHDARLNDSLDAAERLSVLAVLVEPAIAKNAQELPTVAVHLQNERDLRNWLAKQYGEEDKHVRDADGPRAAAYGLFFWNAARDLRLP